MREIFKQIDPEWASGRIVGGLSSGEGLIWEVRDSIVKKEPIRQGGKYTGEYQDVEHDAGVSDKRLLVYEPEFASVLKVMGREGNTLSDIIRKAWDGGDFRTLTKNLPARTSGAHISIIGHITADELRRYLDRTEMANGFANRFIWLCVKRSKVLPHGGRIGTVDFASFIDRLSRSVRFAQNAGRIAMSPETAKLWEEMYGPLSEGKPGLSGALLARGEAQVVRLAMTYALLDQNSNILPDHLKAAMALWRYAEASVRFIFGNALGDPVADQIYAALKNAPSGHSRTAISNILGRNVASNRIQAGLTVLFTSGLARFESTETGGRRGEIWYAITK